MVRKVKVVIVLTIDSDLPLDEAMEEISSECSYDFPSTENVKVKDQEWRDTEEISE